MTESNKAYRITSDEAVISTYDIDEDQDPIPIKAKTARSVSLAHNYLLCNITTQCLLLALMIFFILTENWYKIEVNFALMHRMLLLV